MARLNPARRARSGMEKAPSSFSRISSPAAQISRRRRSSMPCCRFPSTGGGAFSVSAERDSVWGNTSSQAGTFSANTAPCPDRRGGVAADRPVRLAYRAGPVKSGEAAAPRGPWPVHGERPDHPWPRIMSAAFSAIITMVALGSPVVMRGITEPSTTRRPSTPRTRSCGSTTAPSSLPMRQVPTAS